MHRFLCAMCHGIVFRSFLLEFNSMLSSVIGSGLQSAAPANISVFIRPIGKWKGLISTSDLLNKTLKPEYRNL